ncbi:tetratricopeptide repeat protein [Anabaenopsis elenkinii]|jgi:predicted Zn-dependent protease|uniref:Tetratricopeptide repeat protein n=1 Tax=Anabaenopsis elenkinii CCIBt3563 TaxID=2779889 RepID=A0A7U3NMI5_9CYAN|nr:tetratricopeptide repeat protein [Anabaenopsis elenkinii]QOV21634.1 tetratricopeptide repeat protein [Anabaenopsis elenkinii CCIBt3563]
MAQTVEFLFDTGLERYKAGEAPESLIPVFKEVCDRAPKTSSAWICLAWLYLLENQPNLAYKAAQKAVKLNPQDPQARINLAVSMLETGQKGLREHIDFVKQLIFVNPEWESDIKDSIADGLSRKPDWQSLAKVKGWLFEP